MLHPLLSGAPRAAALAILVLATAGAFAQPAAAAGPNPAIINVPTTGLATRGVELGNGRTVYTANFNTGEPQNLWATDGTLAGTVQLTDDDVEVADSAVADDRALVQATAPFGARNRMILTDGTQEGSLPVRTPGVASTEHQRWPVSTGGALFYVDRDADNEYTDRLYAVDPSADPAGDGALVGALVGMPAEWGDGSLSAIRSADGGLWVELYHYGEGQQVWWLDPATGDTRQVVAPGADVAFSLAFADDAGDQLYLSGSSPSTGTEPYVTDGTPGGTKLIGDLVPGPGGSLGASVGIGPFSHFGTTEVVLWRSVESFPRDHLSAIDANGASTEIAIPRGPGGFFNVNGLIPAGDALFALTDGPTYRVDAAGATPIEAFAPFDHGQLGDSAVIGDRTYFVDSDPEAGRELWETDGTPGGARRALDLAGGSASSDPQGLMRVGDLLVFHAKTGTDPVPYLWVFDPSKPVAAYGAADYPTYPVHAPTPLPPATTPQPTSPAPTSPQPTTPEPTTPVSTTPEPPAPAPASPIKTAAPATTPPAATPPVDRRLVPRKVTVKVAKKADATAPYRYTLTGSFKLGADLNRRSECTGEVRITVTQVVKTKGIKATGTVGVFRGKVRWSAGACTFRKTITLTGDDLTGKAGSVKARATYLGSANSAPRSAAPVTLRFG